MKRRARLMYRLYAVGIAQLALVAFSAIGIGYAMSRLAPHHDPRTAIARVEQVANDPAARARTLDELRKRDGLRLSLYEGDGKLLASNVTPALPAPALRERAPDHDSPGRPRHEDGRAFGRHPFGPMHDGHYGPPMPWDHGPPDGPPRFGDHHERRPPPDLYAPIKLGSGEGVLVARFEPHKPSSLPPLLTLLAGLIVFGVGAFLTARWIAGPLAQLARTARALGRGDLRARSGLARDDELGQVGQAFDEMAERIQALMHAERELLANVSHELRTPLARIHVALEIAAEGDTDAARASLAEIAVDLSELETLVDDVLTATRLELESGRAPSGGFALHREEIAPRVVAERATERFRTRKPARTLELSVAAALPLIEVDPMLFRRVLDNLLENADKYTPDSTTAITLRAAVQAGELVFEVEDRGLGIPEADLPRVFEPFFRGERSRSRGTGGVGLGLTLARRIIEAHGGRIEIASTQGKGTCVRIRLPLRTTQRDA